uniref:succinate dehydrogenase subunit 4 n=1 Tax=Caulacanthus ustulatus TaxID=31411 RepID=UPI003001344F|nr:succinate dehydrogenase subunit 4 [Caulacanthus ustulatus]
MITLKWIFMHLIVSLVFTGIFIDSEIICLILGLAFLHINSGLTTILEDYLHLKKIKLILVFLIRALSIELFKLILELVL